MPDRSDFLNLERRARNFDKRIERLFENRLESLEKKVEQGYSIKNFLEDFKEQTTSDLKEGTQKYFTKNRATDIFENEFSKKKTRDIPESENLYFTEQRVQNVLKTIDTDLIAEGKKNQYWTDERFKESLEKSLSFDAIEKKTKESFKVFSKACEQSHSIFGTKISLIGNELKDLKHDLQSIKMPDLSEISLIAGDGLKGGGSLDKNIRLDVFGLVPKNHKSKKVSQWENDAKYITEKDLKDFEKDILPVVSWSDPYAGIPPIFVSGNRIGIDLSQINVEDLSTNFLAGSIPFSDGSNLAEDNANFFWDNAAKRLSLGFNSPEGVIHAITDDPAIFQNAASPVAMQFRRSDGTVASPTAVTGSSTISNFQAQAYNGTGWQTIGAFRYRTDGESGGVYGGQLELRVADSLGVVNNILNVRADKSAQFFGDVGIGVAPLTRFHIQGPQATVRLANDDATSDFWNFGLNPSEDFAINYLGNASAEMKITQDGQVHLLGAAPKVGIGIIPTVPLHILSDVAQIAMEDTGFPGQGWFMGVNVATGGFNFSQAGSGGTEVIFNGQDTALTSKIEYGTGGLVLNERGGDADFRVESLNRPNAFWLNAGDDSISTDIRRLKKSSSITNITAAGGLTPTNEVMKIQGNGGAVTVTATPSIVSPLTDEILIIQGASDTNTVTFQDESNLTDSDLMLDGGNNMTLGKGDILYLRYDGTDGKWYEISRSDN